MKIYRKITDFVNNKIINVKTNTPTEDEHVVNKKYVDDNIVYDTQATQENPNSTKFSWVKNIHQNTIQQVLDKLLYHKDQVSFTEPEFINFNFKLKDNISTGNEAIIQSGNVVKMLFKFEISSTNRTPTSYPKILIRKANLDNTGENIEQYVLTPDEFNIQTNVGEKEITLDFLQVRNIFIEREYNAISGDSVPDSFKEQKIIKTDMLPLLKNKFYIFEPIYYYQIPDTELLDIYNDDATSTTITANFAGYIGPKFSDFVRGHILNLNNTSFNRYAFIFVSGNIDGNGINKCNMEVIIRDKTTNQILSKNIYNYEDFKLKVTRNVSNIGSLMGNFDNLIYTDVTKVDSFSMIYWEFGKFKNNCEAIITFDKLYYNEI